MILVQAPPEWNSPYHPVEFVFDFFKVTFDNVFDTAGKALFAFPSAFPTTFVVGGKIYVESGVYEGEHTITVVGSQTLIETDTDFISDDSAVAANIVIPEFSLAKGYRAWEEYPTELPYEVIATFQPEADPDYQVVINVAGYLQSIFRILPPTNGIDFNMFNKFRLEATYSAAQYQNGIGQVYTYEAKKVVNASIKTNDLMAYYLNGLPLTSTQPGIVFSCDKTIISRLGDVFVNNEILEGIPAGGDYNNDFSDDFLI